MENYILILLAYLIGSIPFALIVGKLKSGADVRNYGSGNLGATNSILVLGKKAGVIVLLGDVGKGVLATTLPALFQSNVNPIYIGVAVVLGHCFPVFAGFRGGKAVATTAGVLISYNPLMFLVGYGVFFIVMYLTKYVFMGSLSIGVALSMFSLYIGDQGLVLLFILFSFFMVYLHRVNITNYLANKEVKITEKKRIRKYQEDMQREFAGDIEIVNQDSGA
ncbi:MULTISPECIES: glycerol-3-phosphate 1-O-acyltransferase PlsY [Bacillaceae]|uniref:Glycerol-3-phosphate acyltransferase n=1 Tax=Evansella alkalicola TaxID=745819 RepID=A0ABS6JR74_9BACI|nr:MULTISPECIES: glycerol-3-phosphate 1-O-acyltransferase PlsY [Bacillaceae]MBU9720925.1 glycerol-3-phosphate 1-O-acyltransferase PlsY [Bacillus alkalicola]